MADRSTAMRFAFPEARGGVPTQMKTTSASWMALAASRLNESRPDALPSSRSSGSIGSANGGIPRWSWSMRSASRSVPVTRCPIAAIATDVTRPTWPVPMTPTRSPPFPLSLPMLTSLVPSDQMLLTAAEAPPQRPQPPPYVRRSRSRARPRGEELATRQQHGPRVGGLGTYPPDRPQGPEGERVGALRAARIGGEGATLATGCAHAEQRLGIGRDLPGELRGCRPERRGDHGLGVPRPREMLDVVPVGTPGFGDLCDVSKGHQARLPGSEDRMKGGMHELRFGIQFPERPAAERERFRAFEECVRVEPDTEGTEGERSMEIDVDPRRVSQLHPLAEPRVEPNARFR